jgi:PKHD-type hydroxylase
MLLQIPEVLTAQQVAECLNLLEKADWVDGRVTSGYQSARVKNNMQLAEDNPVARQMGDMILVALEKNPLFISAALPLKVFPPLFNRYEKGQTFGTHVDGAIRQVPGTRHRVRTDLSATLFLNNPTDYEGGELVVEDTYGIHSIKLEAGSMILYPASSLHKVNPVTSGARVASFFWVQSMVRDDGERTLLFDLDSALQKLTRDMPDHESSVKLIGVYNNLLRKWADA